MFEDLRRSLEDLLNRAAGPEERRDIVAQMKDTLVQARVGLSDLRSGLETTRMRIAAEEKELETVRRRKRLAADIDDTETVTVATRFETHHTERLVVLQRKLAAQEEELALAEREVSEMTAELKRAVGPGGTARTPGAPAATGVGSGAAADPLADQAGEALAGELDALGRSRARAARDAEANRKLEELKRRMGK